MGTLAAGVALVRAADGTHGLGQEDSGRLGAGVVVTSDVAPNTLQQALKLPGGGLAVGEATDRAGVGPGAACLGSIDGGLLAALGPGLCVLGRVVLLVQLLGGSVGTDALVIALK